MVNRVGDLGLLVLNKDVSHHCSLVTISFDRTLVTNLIIMIEDQQCFTLIIIIIGSQIRPYIRWWKNAPLAGLMTYVITNVVNSTKITPIKCVEQSNQPIKINVGTKINTSKSRKKNS
jgi:hypothetical protein